MKNHKLADALSQISDAHILEAAKPKKKHPIRWVAPVAAILAVAVLVGALWNPLFRTKNPQIDFHPESTPTTKPNTDLPPDIVVPPDIVAPPNIDIPPDAHLQYLAAAPVYPQMHPYPQPSTKDAYALWKADQQKLHTQPAGYADSLQSFWDRLTGTLLSNTGGENITCSPVNIYIALAMLAEITGGESRQQILSLLGAETVESLRTQAKHVWEGHYNDDKLTTSILGSSLWLDDAYSYNEDLAKLLAESYYASVFRGDLGSQEINGALQAWLNEQTGGLLKDQANQLELDPLTVLTLVSTIYYNAQWKYKFEKTDNTQGIFNGTNGAVSTVFMNQHLISPDTYYYWGDHFGAVNLPLIDGSRMWLILPNEGVTPEALVASGEVWEFLSQNPTVYGNYANKKSARVNLSLPKFDVSANLDLVASLPQLGITDVFIPGLADFSPMMQKSPLDLELYVKQAEHATRVAVDEDGVSAAAFTVISFVDSMSPGEVVDFTLDRPFLFYIESQDNLPLFTGIVNNP